MSKIFTEYPENINTISEAENQDKDKNDDIKQVIVNLNKICTQLKKQRKMLKKIKKLREIKRISEQMVPADKHSSTDECDKTYKNRCNNKTKTAENEGKSFLSRVSDAFIKALPNIFRTIASVTVSVILGRSTKWFGTIRRSHA